MIETEDFTLNSIDHTLLKLATDEYTQVCIAIPATAWQKIKNKPTRSEKEMLQAPYHAELCTHLQKHAHGFFHDAADGTAAFRQQQLKRLNPNEKTVIPYRQKIPATEVHYREGQPHGIYREWHNNGVLAREDFYTHGLKNGTCREWDGGARMRLVQHLENGRFVNKAMDDNLPPFAAKYFDENQKLIIANDAGPDKHFLFGLVKVPGNHRVEGRALRKRVAQFQETGQDIQQPKTAPQTPAGGYAWRRAAAVLATILTTFRPF